MNETDRLLPTRAIDRLLDVLAVADRLGVSRDTVERMEKRRELERVQISPRRYGFRESDVADIIAGRGNARDFGNK